MMVTKHAFENSNKLLIFIGILLFSFSVFAMTGRTTYQAKIIKPDGYPLEAAAVNFRFTILDPAGSCVLYTENYAAVNMTGTGGVISFALGAGTRSYPVSATTFASVFDNSTPAFACQTAGVYNPIATDNRKIVMQFQDALGWQTLPAMSINAVPYAMYADKSSNALQLNGKSDSDFVEKSTLAALSCNPATHAITFNGVSFSCLAVGSGGGGITGVTTSGTVLVTGGTASAPVISITAATMSQDGYLTAVDYAEFKAKLSASSTQLVSTLGYAPVSSSAVVAQIESAAATSATANSLVKRDASGNATFSGLSANAASLNYVDIYRPSTSFNIRLQAPTSLAANYTLNLPTTSGTTGQVLSTDGAGNLSWINSATGSVTSVSGTTNEITSSGGTNPTLSLANVGTAGTYFKVITDNKGRVTSGTTTLTLTDIPATVLNTTSNFAGDISGLISNITVNRIQGVSVTISSLAANDILQFDGAKYINKNIPTCVGTQYLTFNGTSFSCVADSGASGTITTISVTGPISSTGGTNPTISISQAGLSSDGYLSSSDFTTFNNKQNATSAAIIATLGYTPADNATSGTYLIKSNNLSDLTNSLAARSNLGLGSFAVASSIDLGSASATGTLATARLPAFTGDATVTAGTNSIVLSNSGVTAGTYTKVTVDAKGRVTSSSSLASADVTTALGYTPVSSTATSQWTTSGSTIFYNSGNIGIGTVNPSAALEVSGTIKITGGSPGAGKVLTSDGNGLASWQPSTGSVSGTNYDSGWFNITCDKTYQLNLGFTGFPKQISAFYKLTNGQIIPWGANQYGDAYQMNGAVLDYDATGKIYVRTPTPNGSYTCGLVHLGYVRNRTDSGFDDLFNQTGVQFRVIASDSSGGSQWSSNLNNLSYSGGNVGIGTTSAAATLSVSGGVQIGFDSTCNASKAGTIRYNNSTIELCNGSSFVVVSSGSGGASGTSMVTGWPDAISCYSSGGDIWVSLYPDYKNSTVRSYANPSGYRMSYSLDGNYNSNNGMAGYDCLSNSWSISQLYAQNRAFNFVGGSSVSVNGSTSATQTFATGTAGTAFNINSSNGVHTFNIPLASTGSVTAGLISNADYVSLMNKLTTVDLGSVSATGTLSAARLPAFTGDASSVSGSNVLTLTNSGVISGTYTKVTVDSKGRVVSGSTLTSTDIVNALGYTPVQSSASGSALGVLAYAQRSDTGELTFTGLIPEDNTIPQITEGSEVLSVTVTVPDGSNFLYFNINNLIYGETSNHSNLFTVALFRDGQAGTNALAAFAEEGDYGTNAGSINTTLRIPAPAAGTYTYRIRAGFAAGSFYLNRGINSMSSLAGNLNQASLTVLGDAAGGVSSSYWGVASGGITYSSGNVGIGTSSPAYALSVAGIIHSASGGIRFPDGSLQTTAGGGSSGIAPAFSVYRSTNQTAGANVKIMFDTEIFDTNNNFDITLSRYTPTIAGKYLVRAQVYCISSQGQAVIYKNGVLNTYSNLVGAGDRPTAVAIIEMNGTTDYVEAMGYCANGAADTFLGGASQLNFSGSLLAPLVSGSVAGTGTENSIPMWSNSTNLTNSPITVSGSNVGIGTANPTAKFEVQGGVTKLQQEAWQVPTFQNSWLNYDLGYSPAGYFKDSVGVVHLRGLVKSGTLSACIFTLPAGYRPAYRSIFTVDNFGGTARVDIDPNGCVVQMTGNNSHTSLESITFRAEN